MTAPADAAKRRGRVFLCGFLPVIATAILATYKAFRNQQAGIANRDHEDEARPSRVFAPAGLIPTPAERELMAEWNKLPADLRFERARHH